MLEAFCDSLPEGAVVVEAGAYHGEDTVRLADRLGFVHAFEPVSYQEVCGATAAWSNVEAWRYALGTREEGAEIWVSGGPHTAASSLLAPKEHVRVLPSITFDQRMQVQVTTLEAWGAKFDVGPIDGLWLDLQGMELAVLQAAGTLLDDVRSVVLEASYVELYDGCPLWPDVEAWLAGQGFEVRELIGIGAEQANVLVTRG